MSVGVERRGDTVVVRAGAYEVVISEAGVVIQHEATQGLTPIARSVRIATAEDNEIPALAGDIVRIWYPDSRCVALEWVYQKGAHTVTTEMRVGCGDSLVSLHARDAISGEAEVRRFSAMWEFLAGPLNGGRPDFVWTPCLCPEPGQIVGEHVFRSPAAIVQHGEVSFALVPDLSRISAHQPLRSFLDLHCSNSEQGLTCLSSGVCVQKVEGHVFFTTEGVAPVVLRDTSIEFGCDIFVDALAPRMRGHQAVSRMYWKNHGREWLRDIRPQVLPFRRYYEYGYDFADKHLWEETRANDVRVGAMTISREYPHDIWFQGWFNQLRSAYGLYRWARETGNKERMGRALATRELLFQTPQKNGLFPAIAVLAPADGRPIEWVSSSLQGGGPGVYHLLDSSWTAYWLLQWQLDCEPDVRTLPFCTAYADELVRLQRSDGSFPDYVDVDTHSCVTHYDPTEHAPRSSSSYVRAMASRWGTKRLPASAETAIHAMFLAELSRIVVDGEQYFRAAQDAARYVERNVLPFHKWWDFETFFSCSPKPLDFFDSRSQQYPQNTLSLFWASEAFRILYEITGTAAIGEQSLALTDYLCLFQQVWSPPFLSFYGFGGFGVMNTDGEWNDARQALFAEGLARQYLQSGRQEYLERAIAATRAGFACAYIPENADICPRIFARKPTGYADENYAHGGYDAPAGPSGFDWGIGSALTTAIRMLDWFGDLWVDVYGGWALGIDALTVTSCRREGDVWHLTVDAPLRHTDTITVKGNPGEGEPVCLSLNGQQPVVLTDEALRKGTTVRLYPPGQDPCTR